MTGGANTHDEIADKLITYLMLRGETTMRELGDMSPDMTTVANAIDAIGWVDIMHGRLPIALRRLQQQHYQLTGDGSATVWMTQLTRRIIDIGHGQWLFRNFTLHNNANGYLLLQKKEEVLTSITQLADSAPSDIPAESQFLLEIDPSNLIADSLLQQEYWVAAMKAALAAGRRRGNRTLRRPQHQPLTRLPRSSRAQRLNLYRIGRRSKRILRQLREELDLHLGSGRLKRPSDTLSGLANGSNKRLQKPD